MNSLDLLLKAIAACDNYGRPAKPIFWKSDNHPLGHTSFLRFCDNGVTAIKSLSGLITGYKVDIWLNDCGTTYKTTWRFGYFISSSRQEQILTQIIGINDAL